MKTWWNSWFVHKNVKMIHQYKLKKTKAKIERRNLKLFWTLQKKSNLYSSKFPSLAECEVKQKNTLHIKSDKNIWNKISCSESCIATALYDYCHFIDLCILCHMTQMAAFKVHIFWEGHKILRNLPLHTDQNLV